MKVDVRKLSVAGLFLALCLTLPFLTAQIPQIGQALLPMHIPVLLCGFVCGWRYALLVGAVAPLLRFVLFGMPPLFPTGVAMAFELAAYGAVTALLYRALPDKPLSVYAALVIAMLAGRVVWGLARYTIAGLQGTVFTFPMFLAGAFSGSVPGIIIHIALIPPLVIALRRAGLIARGS